MAKTLVVVLLLLAVAGWSSAELSSDEQKKCQGEVQKMVLCLPYAQKSTAEPTTDCCKSLSDIRTADAACLCYLLETTLRGDTSAKALNLDKDRMLALPNVCKLQNTSISDCPALLNLSPDSPDISLFKSPGSAGVSPNVSSTTGVGSPSSSSGAYLQLPFSRFMIYAVFVAVLFIIYPSSSWQ